MKLFHLDPRFSPSLDLAREAVKDRLKKLPSGNDSSSDVARESGRDDDRSRQPPVGEDEANGEGPAPATDLSSLSTLV